MDELPDGHADKDEAIHLEPEEVKEWAQSMALVEMHQRTARLIERGIYAEIEEKYGIDLQKENWTLDVDLGVLRPADLVEWKL